MHTSSRNPDPSKIFLHLTAISLAAALTLFTACQPGADESSLQTYGGDEDKQSGNAKALADGVASTDSSDAHHLVNTLTAAFATNINKVLEQKGCYLDRGDLASGQSLSQLCAQQAEAAVFFNGDTVAVNVNGDDSDSGDTDAYKYLSEPEYSGIGRFLLGGAQVTEKTGAVFSPYDAIGRLYVDIIRFKIGLEKTSQSRSHSAGNFATVSMVAKDSDGKSRPVRVKVSSEQRILHNAIMASLKLRCAKMVEHNVCTNANRVQSVDPGRQEDGNGGGASTNDSNDP